MRATTLVSVVVSVLSAAGSAPAQPATEPLAVAEEPPAGDVTPSEEPAASPPAPAASPPAPAAAPPPAPAASSPPPEPEPQPPPEPRPDEQTPLPYLPASDAGPAASNLGQLDLGALVGVTWRPARDGGGVSYGPGPAWGGYARARLLDWLGARALVVASRLPVEVDRGALGPDASTDVDQPDLRTVLLGFQLEGTWNLDPRLGLWLSLGTGWATIDAPPARSLGEADLATARRTGVLVDVTAGVGATYEIWRNWLRIGLTAQGGVLANQSGDVFRPVQAIEQSPPAESIDHYQGLPRFAASLSSFVTLGIIL